MPEHKSDSQFTQGGCFSSEADRFLWGCHVSKNCLFFQSLKNADAPHAACKRVVQSGFVEHALGVFHVSIFMSLGDYWQLCPQVKVRGERVELCYASLWMEERQLAWIWKTLSAQLLCAVARTPPCPMTGVSPPRKAVFLSFQSSFVCRLQPYWFYLVLAL